jgi:hypothetical protein
MEPQGRREDIQGQDEIEGDPDITLPVLRPQHVWGAGVSLQQDEQEDDVHPGVEAQPDEIERDNDIALPDHYIARHQHAWGAGVSLGRHPYNPHAIDPVIHAQSAAEAAEARSRIPTVHHQGKYYKET